MPVLENVLEPGGDLVLVLTSDAVLSGRQDIERQRELAKSSSNKVPSQLLHTLSDSPADQPVDKLVPGGDIRILVSSEILKRKSPVVKCWLQDGSYHAELLKQKTLVEFVDEEVDPVAFEWILNWTCYDRWAEVPGFDSGVEITFADLVEALVIIDKYDFHQATHILKREWWHMFQHLLPAHFWEYATNLFRYQDLDLRAWISVLHVLSQPQQRRLPGTKEKLELLFRIYKSYSTGFPDADRELPLPDKLEMADMQRLTALQSFNKLLQEYHKSVHSSTSWSLCTCNNATVAKECDRKTLEHLKSVFSRRKWLIRSSRAKRGDPVSEAPQLDPSKVSVQELLDRVPRIHFPHACAERQQQQRNQAKAKAQAQAQAHSAGLYGMHPYIYKESMQNGSTIVHWTQAPTPSDILYPHQFSTSTPFDVTGSITTEDIIGTRRSRCRRSQRALGPVRIHDGSSQSSFAPAAAAQAQAQTQALGGLTSMVMPSSHTQSLGYGSALANSHQAHHNALRGSNNPVLFQAPVGNVLQQQWSGGFNPLATWSFPNPLNVNAMATDAPFNAPPSAFDGLQGPGDMFGYQADIFATKNPHENILTSMDRSGSGNGATPGSAIDVEMYVAGGDAEQRREEQEETLPILPCDPSPGGRIGIRIAEIEKILHTDVPEYKHPIVLD